MIVINLLFNVMYYTSLCDYRVFPDPDEFRPERFAGRSYGINFIPFGEGPRNCVGMRFALIQVKFALIRLIQNYTLELGEAFKVSYSVEYHSY